jgi:hypothetical protein
MKFRDFSKNLSDEIENLFATMGDNCLPEDAGRLDDCFSMADLMERLKKLDADTANTEQNRPQ